MTTIDPTTIIGDWTGTPDALLANFTGSWSSLKPTGRMVLCRVAPEPLPSKMQRGITLGGVGYPPDGDPFANLMDSCRVMDDSAVSYDSQDWPMPAVGGAPINFLIYEGEKLMPPGEYAVAVLNGKGCRVIMLDKGGAGPHPPSGDHRDNLVGANFTTTAKPGHKGGAQFQVFREQQDATPPRIHFQRVGHGVYQQDYIDTLRRFSVVRLLGYNELYADAPHGAETPTAFSNWIALRPTQAYGVCHPQFAAALCINAGATPWHCVPDGQSPDYYRKFASHLKNAGGVHIIEYGNEISWNRRMAGTHRLARRGGQTQGDTEAIVQQQYAREALQCFRIFKEVLGSNFRGYLGGQIANSNVLENVLAEAVKAQDFHELVHAAGAAGYWYPTLTPQTNPNASVRMLVTNCSVEIRNTLRNRLDAHELLCRRYGVWHWLYEAGPHEPGDMQGHPFYQPYLHSQEIAENYDEMIAVCEASGVDLVCHMGLLGTPTASWFLAQSFAELDTAPRGKAFLADYARGPVGGGA